MVLGPKRKSWISMFIFSMKYYCLVELDWTFTDILKHKRIIFYGIFYPVRNSITFIFLFGKGLATQISKAKMMDP